MVRAVAPKSTNRSTGPLQLVDIKTTQEVVATSMPVGGVSGEQTKTLARMVIDVQPGDVLVIDGWQRVSNNIGPVEYTVGAGYWPEVYDVDDGLSTSDPDRVWLRVSSLNGQNVDNNVVHHLPLTISGAVWHVPQDWPAGHRATVCFRADAHSTGWKRNGGGDKITVDDYGVLTVHQWRPAVEEVGDGGLDSGPVPDCTSV